MELIGAKYNAADRETRFVFFSPNEKDPGTVRGGKGVILVMKGVEQMLVPGEDTDYREITSRDLEAYCDKLCNGGGIECGIGISDNKLQIVTYEEGDLLFMVRFRTLAMACDVNIDDLPSMQ